MRMFVIDFPAGWYALFAFFFFIWLATSYVRKDYRSGFRFGFAGLILSIFVESIGVGLGLWSYAGGNWPVILWLCYFFSSMAFYQIIKIIEKRAR